MSAIPARASRSAPSARSAPMARSSATVIAGMVRGAPSSILTAPARPSARANACTPSAPDLTSSPGTAWWSSRSERLVPDVHAPQSRLDLALQRMVGVTVGLRGPAGRDASGEHGRVLARAIHVHSVRPAALAEESPERGLVHRQRGRALQRVLGQPGTGQDLPDPGDVEVLAGVARAGQRQELALDGQAAGAHGGGLYRLVRGPGEHGSGDLSRAEQHLVVSANY